MLNIKKIENNLDECIKKLSTRNKDYSKELKEIFTLNKKRKEIISSLEQLKAVKNDKSKSIGILMKEKKVDKVEQLKKEISLDSEKITMLESEFDKVVKTLEEKILFIPNIPNDDIPLGKDEEDNIEIRKWNKDQLKKDSAPHWEIAEKLDIVDFKLGPKLSGSRFIVYKGIGSKIVRAIADIMLDIHTKNGYKELFLPLIVNEEIMYGTGNLPKFKDDAYIIGKQYLIPTSEVPMTNIHRNEILNKKDLPLYLTSFTQCFRQEAGSAGRDTKGMIRLHQFNKVEMVKMSEPDSSYEELEKMVLNAEEVLKAFGLPYRVVELCGGDLGFSSMKTYDLEVWFPNQNKYREISSCSNCGDFQARRMNTKYRVSDTQTDYIHTLNGSGVAIDRIFAAILENYWNGEELIIPDVLRPYLGGIEKLIVSRET